MIVAASCSPCWNGLAAEGSRTARVARYLTETFITDVDDYLREMGVGDMAVPKKVKRAAQSLGECCLAYRRAVESADPAAAWRRNSPPPYPASRPIRRARMLLHAGY